MVKINFVIILFLFGFNSYSQFQINYEDFPQSGENYIMAVKNLKYENFSIDEIGTGKWDISTLVPDTYDTVRYMKAGATRYGKLFSESNLVKYVRPTQSEYYKITANTVEKVGLIGDFINIDAAVILYFPDAILQLTLPIKFGDFYADTASKHFLSRYYIKPGVDSIRADMLIIEQASIDAYGTLKTPFSTYETLREKRIVKKDVRGYKFSMFGWTPAAEYTSKSVEIYYRWYQQGSGVPVAEIKTDASGKIYKVSYQFSEPITLAFSGKDVSCKGGTNGAVEIFVKGGIPGYQYHWSNNSTTKNLYDVPAGSYTVQVTDNKNNQATGVFSVSEPQQQLAMQIDTTPVQCYGQRSGALAVRVKGGIPPYYIVWSTDTVSSYIRNLEPGVYGVIVKDSSRCFIWDSVEITAPAEPLNLEYETQHVSCKNGSNGKAFVKVSGGTPPYSYYWSNGQKTDTLTNVKAGKYSITITDKHNCIKTRELEITEPAELLQTDAIITHVNCKNRATGAINLQISGGRPPYQIFWSTQQTDKYLQNLSAGIYKAQITDNNGCSISDTINITQPTDTLGAVVTKTDVDCYMQSTGSIAASVYGGTPPYEYLWNTGEQKKMISDCKKGNYNVKITDKNGCFVRYNMEISQPSDALSATAQVENILCAGDNTGKINLTVSGGSPPYSIFCNNKLAQAEISGCYAGTYQIKITDSKNCTFQKEYVISEPDEKLEIAAQLTHIACNNAGNGSIALNISGGKPGYRILWSNGSENKVITNLGPGTYSVAIKDNAACIKNFSYVISEAPILEADFEIIRPKAGKSNGKVVVSTKGGTPPYSYIWTTGSKKNVVTGLGFGSISVEITDNNNCKLIKNIQINEN